MIAIEVAAAPQHFDCATCAHRHCDATGEIAGSNGPAGYPKWAIEGVIESQTCLLPMVAPQSRTLLHLYRHYEQGVLAVAGGILDQPNAYLQAMEVIASHDRRSSEHSRPRPDSSRLPLGPR